MSFPNIPDINPCISITLEEAVNLLLASIALEEVSLSKLMDAEASKISCVLKDCKHKDCCSHDCRHEECVLNDALIINKSVENTMQNLIKMQMLLQFKLEKVKEIIPTSSTTTCSTTSTSTTTTTTCTKTTTTRSTTSSTTSCTTTCTTTSSTTTCTKTTTTKSTTASTTSCTTTCTTTSCTTTCTYSTFSTTTKEPYGCCLTGKGAGCVKNPCDEFNGHKAKLKAFVYCSDIKNRSIHYSVGKKDICLDFYASGYKIKIECPCNDSEIILYGKGRINKKLSCNSVMTDTAKFRLTVRYAKGNQLEFNMEIFAAIPQLNHNSGNVKVKGYTSTLAFKAY